MRVTLFSLLFITVALSNAQTVISLNDTTYSVVTMPRRDVEEVDDGIIGVNEDFVAAEVAGTAVQGSHFRSRNYVSGSQSFQVGHTNSATGGGLNDSIRAFLADCVDAFLETSGVLSRSTVIPSYVKVD